VSPWHKRLDHTGPTAFANGVSLELLEYSGPGESERVFRTRFGGKTTMLQGVDRFKERSFGNRYIFRYPVLVQQRADNLTGKVVLREAPQVLHALILKYEMSCGYY
jgi:hypothetical protein